MSYRLTPRQNDAVNDTWMSDSGRLLYKEIRTGRLDSVRVGGVESPFESAVHAASEIFGKGGVAVVGSGRSSIEEQFLTRKLAEALGTRAHLLSRVGQGDGLLISADRSPNVRGGLVTGLISELPSARLDALREQVDSGAVKTVVSIGEDLTAAGLDETHLAKIRIIYVGTHANLTSAAAAVALPSLTVFEKNGTLINQQFRIQRFSKAVPGPASAIDDLVILSRLGAAAGGTTVPSDIGALWAESAAGIPALAAVSYSTIPETGLLIDPSPWSALRFVEGPSLHFKPEVARG